MLLALIREQKKNLQEAQKTLDDLKKDINLLTEKELRRQLLHRLINKTEYNLLIQRYELFLLN